MLAYLESIATLEEHCTDLRDMTISHAEKIGDSMAVQVASMSKGIGVRNPKDAIDLYLRAKSGRSVGHYHAGKTDSLRDCLFDNTSTVEMRPNRGGNLGSYV